MSIEIFVLSTILSFILGFFISFLLYKLLLEKRYHEDGKRMAQLENSELTNSQIKTGILEHKETSEFKALLEIEFHRGIEVGGKKELDKFNLIYEPYIDITDNFFKHSADAGYTMQIFYNGLPIGDPIKRIIKHEEKFKDDNLKYLLASVMENLNNIKMLAKPSGIPIKVIPNPKIEKVNN